MFVCTAYISGKTEPILKILSHDRQIDCNRLTRTIFYFDKSKIKGADTGVNGIFCVRLWVFSGDPDEEITIVIRRHRFGCHGKESAVFKIN